MDNDPDSTRCPPDGGIATSVNMVRPFRFHARCPLLLLAALGMLFGSSFDTLAGEIPPGLLTRLGAPDFATREAAEKELTAWAQENPETAMDELRRMARQHEVAEVRMRGLSVLRTLVREIYESEGQGYLGIRMRDEAVALPGGGDDKVPVVAVFEVMPDSAAEKGGVKVGDLVVSVNDRGWGNLPAGNPASLLFQERIKALKPKDEVKLTVIRDGAMVDLKVRLARRPAALENPYAEPLKEEMDAIERERREEHFKKWLLDQKDER